MHLIQHQEFRTQKYKSYCTICSVNVVALCYGLKTVPYHHYSKFLSLGYIPYFISFVLTLTSLQGMIVKVTLTSTPPPKKKNKNKNKIKNNKKHAHYLIRIDNLSFRSLTLYQLIVKDVSKLMYLKMHII